MHSQAPSSLMVGQFHLAKWKTTESHREEDQQFGVGVLGGSFRN
jgi:hypothetical protein